MGKQKEYYRNDENLQPMINVCVGCYFDKKEEKIAKFVYDGKSMCEECVETELNLQATLIENSFK